MTVPHPGRKISAHMLRLGDLVTVTGAASRPTPDPHGDVGIVVDEMAAQSMWPPTGVTIDVVMAGTPRRLRFTAETIPAFVFRLLGRAMP